MGDLRNLMTGNYNDKFVYMTADQKSLNIATAAILKLST